MSSTKQPNATGLGYLGLRLPTAEQFAAAKSLFGDALGMTVVLDETDRCWFAMADGTPVHIFGPTDEKHAFLGERPCVGFAVENVADARARLQAAGLDVLSEVASGQGRAWCHFRGPDGAVYELIGNV